MSHDAERFLGPLTPPKRDYSDEADRNRPRLNSIRTINTYLQNPIEYVICNVINMVNMGRLNLILRNALGQCRSPIRFDRSDVRTQERSIIVEYTILSHSASPDSFRRLTIISCIVSDMHIIYLNA